MVNNNKQEYQQQLTAAAVARTAAFISHLIGANTVLAGSDRFQRHRKNKTIKSTE